MTELKKAAKQLLDKLKPLAKKDGDVKVAIIPFNTDVNMGTNNVGANWIRWDEWESRRYQSHLHEKRERSNGQ